MRDARKIDPTLKVLSPEPTANPIARVVSEESHPVVSKSEVMSEAAQRMIQNSGELEKIESRQDAQQMLDDSAAHIQRNLDPHVGKRITFDAQKQLATELRSTAEDPINRKSGEAYNAEEAIAARALLRDSQARVMNLARIAAMGDEDYQGQNRRRQRAREVA